MARKYHHRSFLKCLGTQYFISRPVYAVKVSEESETSAETYALYSKRQVRQAKHKLKIDHVDRIEEANLFKVLWQSIREYFWGWKLQFSKEDPCGCRVWRGQVGVYCSSEHMFERFGIEEKP
jgi:hypothetical protein